MSGGLLLGSYLALFSLRFVGGEWLVMAVCLALIGFRRRDVLAVLFIVAAGLLIGLWRAGNELRAQQAFEQFYGQTVSVVGRVTEDPSYDTDGDMKLRLVDVRIDGQSVAGQLWAATSDRRDIKRSDYVTVEGQLSQGFGTIPAAMYRASIAGIERRDYADVGRDTRDSFAGGVREAIREPEASLGAGFLLGQKTALPEKLDNELQLLGLTHIVVASGYNLTILVRFARRLFARVSRFSALALSGLLVFGFANITGFSPSMSRASLIAGLSLLAWYYGRKFHPVVLLSFSAAVTVAINPAYAWGDLGWLLSFTSFIGVIMFAPLVNQYFWGEQKPGAIRQVFIETMSAQALTLPIIMLAFERYSALSLPANVLVLPLIPIAMLLTSIAGIGGLLLPSAASQIIGWPAEILMRYMTAVVSKLAELPAASQEVTITPSAVAVFYIILFGVGIFLWRRSGHVFRDYNVVE